MIQNRQFNVINFNCTLFRWQKKKKEKKTEVGKYNKVTTAIQNQKWVKQSIFQIESRNQFILFHWHSLKILNV